MAIAVAVVNGFFVLLAALVPSIDRWLKSLRERPKRKRLIIWGLVLGMAAAAGSLTIISVRYATHPSPKATITSPAGSPAAPADIQLGGDIEGRASYLPHDQLFLVLGSTQGGGLRYYPQAQVSDWTGTDWKAAFNALPGAGRYDLMAMSAAGEN